MCAIMIYFLNTIGFEAIESIASEAIYCLTIVNHQ